MNYKINYSRNKPAKNSIRLWTIQPLAVWTALREQQFLLVNTDHPDFVDHRSDSSDAYEWMRTQMRMRVPGYEGHYPWWAYEHFLDLRFYRWHMLNRGQRLVRLELAIPQEKVLLSAYGPWHCVLNRGYLPEALAWEDYERELDRWQSEVERQGIDLYDNPLPDPWETQMRLSWERIFDVERRRPTETIQATFETLEFSQVMNATEFTSVKQRVNKQGNAGSLLGAYQFPA